MAITTEERRFMRHWEEQRKGGKRSYLAVYTFGYFVVLFMMGVAIGLFSGLRFVDRTILAGLAIASLVGAFAFSQLQWRRSEHRFRRIINRVVEENNGEITS